MRITINSDYEYHAYAKPLFRATSILTQFNLNKLNVGSYMFRKLADHLEALQSHHNYFADTVPLFNPFSTGTHFYQAFCV